MELNIFKPNKRIDHFWKMLENQTIFMKNGNNQAFILPFLYKLYPRTIRLLMRGSLS